MSLLGFRKGQSAGSEFDRGPRRWAEIEASHDEWREPSLIGRCSNPACRSGWLQLFRSRNRPVFEGGWTCSGECTRKRLEVALRRELDGRVPETEPHRHRIPLGLVMLERGWITSQQLREAVTAQRNEGGLRIGEWLVKLGATSEAMVSRAVSVQWGCPVLPSTGLTLRPGLLPRLFVEAFGALPLEDASGRMSYLGFEQDVDTALAFAAERITGKRVECGIVPTSSYVDLLSEVRNQSFARAQVAEAASEPAAAHLFAKAIERTQPGSSSLSRVHGWLWLRMKVKAQSGGAADCEGLSDVVCRVGPLS